MWLHEKPDVVAPGVFEHVTLHERTVDHVAEHLQKTVPLLREGAVLAFEAGDDVAGFGVMFYENSRVGVHAAAVRQGVQ